ncbi:MAG: RES family NAD+ phosphorylase [Rhodococcus sp.]|nr:RES family NAD+ phosphorylase [Rhodococcus sp. (in: high G+C Gram-positive bacteria)]
MLPKPPSEDDLKQLGILPDEIETIHTEQVVWRVHRTIGAHSLPWNVPRAYGPLLRFDPHPLPRRSHPTLRVWYGAADIPGALAEGFQSTRIIDRELENPYLTGFRFTRPLRLLDIGGFGAGRWPVRVGGTYALDTGPRSVTQQWARTMCTAHPDLDGLLYRGRHSGGRCLALFAPASDAFPTAPLSTNPLAHPDLYNRLALAAKTIGYTLD